MKSSVKRKLLIIIIIILFVISLYLLIPNVTTKNKRFEELLLRISETNKIMIYGSISGEDEYITYLRAKYNLFKIIDNAEEVKEMIEVLSDIELYNGPIITPMPEYIIHLYDEDNNLLEEFTTHPFTASSLSVRLKKGSKNLYEIIERDKIGYNCLVELDNYLTDENDSINMPDILNDITTKETLKFSKIVTTDNDWIYALINTNDPEVISDFDKYFKQNYNGYIKKNLVDNFILYFYNGDNDLDEEKLGKCIK